MNPKEELAKAKKIDQDIWDRQDIKAMALSAINTISVYVEDGMDKEKALDLIYRFAHCAQDCICYDSHEDWRKELKRFYKKEILRKD